MYFFDLDGTLLDSNGIWLDIDRDFLARHGVTTVPEDYTEYVTHHSFPDAAAYTRRRFGLDMPEEDICRAWLDMALEAYSHQLPLKPGAGDYVRPAHERGERCALLSSCMPELCRGLALTREENGLDLTDPSDPLYVCAGAAPKEIFTGERIGIDYAQEAVHFPWRFWTEE